MNSPPRAPGRRANAARALSAASSAAPGFTLLELAIVIFIMGLLLTLVMPYLGGFRQAALRSQARRLAGRATFLYDEAAGQKMVLRLTFDIDRNVYTVAGLDPYALRPVFLPDRSPAGRPVVLPAAIRIRDVSVEGFGTFNRGIISTTFYPGGYVDATVVHLEDASQHVMTLIFTPLTGKVLISDGDFMPKGMFN
jgi:prepilin-type N-terminal cleavage/methylation domain-containing protein